MDRRFRVTFDSISACVTRGRWSLGLKLYYMFYNCEQLPFTFQFPFLFLSISILSLISFILFLGFLSEWCRVQLFLSVVSLRFVFVILSRHLDQRYHSEDDVNIFSKYCSYLTNHPLLVDFQLSVSLCVSLPLSVCLSVCLSLSLSLCLCLSVSVCLCFSVSVCLCLSVSVSVPVPVSPSVSLSVCLALSLSLSVEQIH